MSKQANLARSVNTIANNITKVLHEVGPIFGGRKVSLTEKMRNDLEGYVKELQSIADKLAMQQADDEE